MAVFLWFLVIVLISTQEVFSRNCADVDNIKNCNDCIRCGAYWCRERQSGEHRCTSSPTDAWCPNHKAKLPEIKEVKEPGTSKNLDFVRYERTVRVNSEAKIDISFNVKNPEIKIIGQNSTQNDIDNIIEVISTSASQASIKFSPDEDFCLASGGTHEYVNINLRIGELKEDVSLKFHVPCACNCSSKVEEMSVKCNKRGNYSCGICSCEGGWTGDYCEIDPPKTKTTVKNTHTCNTRGDISCTHPVISNVDCSGNGKCGPCGCECDTNKEGHQYFDKYYFCADLCMTINYDNCDECLKNNTIGECDYCPLTKQRFNKTLLQERDEYNNKVWVMCNKTLDDDSCDVKYAAKKNELGEITIMLIEFCGIGEAAPIVNYDVSSVGIILGVLAAVAIVAAAAGYMVWKNRTPPLPMAGPQYHDIDAEDCTGENPLYKPPTSSFKNPTYGRW